jgi:hypothetical protein
MSLSFPLAMPASGPARQVFEPMQVNYSSPAAGGRTYAVAAGPARWRGDWTLGTALQGTLSDQWRAFVAALKGASREFLAHDFERPFPRIYPTGFGAMTRAGGGSFDGSATSWSQSIAADGQCLLTLNGMPAALQLSAGDYVDFRWTTSGAARRSLVRLLEAATASGAGVISSVSVEPAIPSVTSGSAVAHLDNPACVMKLDIDQTEITAMDRRRVAGGRIVGVQVILP